jgi:hypothetical protein
LSTFRKIILYGLYIVAVGVLAGVIVKSFYPSTTKSNTNTASKSSVSTTTSKHQATAGSQTKAAASELATTKRSTTTAASTTPQKSQPSATTPASLENTGPGNIISVFVTAFIAGTLGFHAFLKIRNRRVIDIP